MDEMQESIQVSRLAQLFDSGMFRYFPKLQFMRDDISLLKRQMEDMMEKLDNTKEEEKSAGSITVAAEYVT